MMAMWNNCIISLLLLPAVLEYVKSHICLLHPHQRGHIDVRTSGSEYCYRISPPCGGKKAREGPYPVMYGGRQTFIKWQQNANHYTVGYPGYMDISIARNGSDKWQTLAFIPDEYVHAQDYRRNYTAIVTLPYKDCQHCIIRARYNSHKPLETTFYQCADISVKQTKPTILRNDINAVNIKHQEHKTILKNIQSFQQKSSTLTSNFTLKGFSYSPFSPNILYIVNVTMDGQVIPFGEIEMGLNFKVQSSSKEHSSWNSIRNVYSTDSPIGPYLLDSVLTVNSANNIFGMYHEGGMDQPPTGVVEIDTTTGKVLYTSWIGEFDGYPFSGIIYNEEHGYYNTFSLQSNGSKGYFFVVGQLHIEKNMLPYIYTELFRLTPELTYVNYQWLELDQKRQLLMVLMGNEMTPDGLQAGIYTFDLRNMSFLKFAEVDVIDFTFMNFHYYEKTGLLYAMSPGRWLQDHWSLVHIDPMTGNVTKIFEIPTAGYFRHVYGGSVFNGLDQDTGDLYHVMTLKGTNANVIMVINLNTYSVKYSEITNLSHVYNMALTKTNSKK